MRKYMFCLLMFLLCCFSLHPREDTFGIGIIAGEPTGFSLKYWLDDKTAVDGGLAYSFMGAGVNIHLHSDYLYHFFDVFGEPAEGLIPYMGLGGSLGIGDESFMIALRIPFGAGYLFSEVPIEIFLELAPGMSVLPGTAFAMSGGVGVRWYLNPSK